MDAINTLRAILAGGAALAAVVAGVTGRWSTVAVLVAAVAGHLWLWVRLYRGSRGAASEQPSAPPASSPRPTH